MNDRFSIFIMIIGIVVYTKITTHKILMVLIVYVQAYKYGWNFMDRADVIVNYLR